MSCEGSRRVYYAQQGAISIVTTAFGGTAADAAQALDEIFAVARAQAAQQIAMRRADTGAGPQGRIAALRARAEDAQAEQDTRALFAEMRDRYGLRPPVHSPSGLPRKDAQYGYAAVYRTLKAILAGVALPALAQQVRDALRHRSTNSLPTMQPVLPAALTTPAPAEPTTRAAVASPVQISSRTDRRDYEQTLSLRAIKQRRLHHLQIKQSRLGAACDVSVPMEIEDLQAEIVTLDSQVAAYARVPTHVSPLLSEEQQRQALLTLAAIIGVAPERISLIDIVVGSIVLVIELPLAEAARLLALQRLLPQALLRAGFVRVVPDLANAHLQGHIAQAVAHAQATLMAPIVDSQSDTPDTIARPGPTVRLRVTLAEQVGIDNHQQVDKT